MQEVLEGGFKYDRYSGIVTCTVCSEDSRAAGKFYYSAHQWFEFDDDKHIPKDFSSLKRNVTKLIWMQLLIRAKEKAKNNLISKNR